MRYFSKALMQLVVVVFGFIGLLTAAGYFYTYYLEPKVLRINEFGGPLTEKNTIAKKATKVVVYKARRKLMLLNGTDTIARFKIALGKNPVGPKMKEGDFKTPEGSYIIDYRNAKSGFYRSLHISYPTAAQKKAAKVRGESPGGDVMIHGLQNGKAWIGAAHSLHDWTWGCIALTNEEVDSVWNAVKDGTPITIKP